MEAGTLCPPETFSSINHYKRELLFIKQLEIGGGGGMLGRIENA